MKHEYVPNSRTGLCSTCGGAYDDHVKRIGRPRKINSVVERELCEWYAGRRTVAQKAAELGINPDTAWSILKRNGLSKPRRKT